MRTHKLLEYVDIRYGIETGCNEYFILRVKDAIVSGIPNNFFKAAIVTTDDLFINEITQEVMVELAQDNVPTLLLSTDDREVSEFPPKVANYLRAVEGVIDTKKGVLANRIPWYRMPRQEIAPILFSTLCDGGGRFIKNTAEVIALKPCFCLYPYNESIDYIDQLWSVLTHPDTHKNIYNLLDHNDNNIDIDILGDLIIPPRLAQSIC